MLGFNFLFCVCYVNPAYGCQTEINCVYVRSGRMSTIDQGKFAS